MQAIDKIEGLNIGHGTHEGMSGKHNEDSYGFFAWDNGSGKPLYIGVVADGVGGQTAGEVASSLAVEAIQNYFRQQERVHNNISGHLERAVLAANKAVFEYSQGHTEVSGMGTTMVLVAIYDQKLYTTYVGDSRIYLYRDGVLLQITVDHTWAQEAIQIGLLTREQAKTHPNRNVIKRFLGGFPEVEVDHRLVVDRSEIGDDTRINQGLLLQVGDIVLLCSDGLSDMIDDQVIQESLTTYQTQLQSGVHDLINKANQAGGRDNITALVLQIPGKAKAPGMLTGRLPRMTTASMPAITTSSIPTAAISPPTASTSPVPERRRSRLPFILAGIGLLVLFSLVIVVLVVGTGLLRQTTDTPSSTSTLTTIIATGEPGSSNQQTTQSAATLAVIEVMTQGNETLVATVVTTQLAEPTLGLIPTYTNTPTLRPPTATYTRSPTATPSITPSPIPGGGGGGSSPTNPPPTNPPPTNPPPTNPPPTNTPPPPSDRDTPAP